MSNINNNNNSSRTNSEGRGPSRRSRARRSREASSSPLVRQNATHSSPEARDNNALESEMPDGPPPLINRGGVAYPPAERASHGARLEVPEGLPPLIRQNAQHSSADAKEGPSAPLLDGDILSAVAEELGLGDRNRLDMDVLRAAFEAQRLGEARAEENNLRLEGLEPLEDNVEVSQKECPITLSEPAPENAIYILYGENNDRAHIFDRGALEEWLRNHNTHPVTRERIENHQLRRAKTSEES